MKPFLAFLLILTSLSTIAQTQFSGWVFDRETREPLHNAHIYLQGSGRGGVTLESGYFKMIAIPKNALPGTIQVSMMGYRTRNIEVTKKFRDTIFLEPGVFRFAEAMAVGDIDYEDMGSLQNYQRRTNFYRQLSTGILSVLFKSDTSDFYISSIELYFEQNIPDQTRLRVFFQDKDSLYGQPGPLLYQKALILDPEQKKRSGWQAFEFDHPVRVRANEFYVTCPPSS